MEVQEQATKPNSSSTQTTMSTAASCLARLMICRGSWLGQLQAVCFDTPGDWCNCHSTLNRTVACMHCIGPRSLTGSVPHPTHAKTKTWTLSVVDAAQTLGLKLMPLLAKGFEPWQDGHIGRVQHFSEITGPTFDQCFLIHALAPANVDEDGIWLHGCNCLCTDQLMRLLGIRGGAHHIVTL